MTDAAIPTADPGPASWRGWTFFATRTTLSLRTYLTILPVALAAAAFAVPGASGSVIVTWLAAGIVAEIVVGGVFLAGWFLLKRTGTRHPIGTRTAVVATVFLAYALRGIILVLFTRSFDVPDTTGPALRVLASTLNMSLWTFLVGAMWQARDAYQRELRAAGERLAHVRARHVDAVDDRGVQIPLEDEFRSVQSRLVDLLDRFGEGDPREWADDLQQAIDDDLRPLSHRLASRHLDRTRRWVRLRQLLWRARSRPVALVPVAVVLTVVTLTNTLLRYPVPDAVIVIATYAPLLAASLLLVQMLRTAGLPAEVTNAVLLVFVAGLVPMVQSLAVEWLLPRTPDIAGPVAVALASGSIIIVTAVVQAAQSIATDRIREISEEISALDLLHEFQRRASEDRGWQTGTYLHNVVQSRLTAMRLEASADPFSITAASLAETRKLVTSAGLSSKSSADPLAELEQAVRSWSGVVSISLHVDADVDPTHPDLARLCSFAQEAVANAVRHGEATTVAVELAPDLDGPRAGSLRCRITDNGTWMPDEGTGMGLASHSDLGITVDVSRSGTVVTAVAP